MRRKVLEDIQSGLERMKQYGMAALRFECDEMNRLNPYFGFKDKDTSLDKQSKGVQSVWLGDKVEDIAVHTLPTGYAGKAKDYDISHLSHVQLVGINQWINNLCEEHIKNRVKWKENPVIESLAPQIQKVVNELLEREGKRYSLKWGRDDDGKYQFSIYENQMIKGTIPVMQLDNGKLEYNIWRPGLGQWANNLELKEETYYNQLKKGIERIIGKELPTEKRDRITNVVMFHGYNHVDMYICCKIEGHRQIAKRMSEADVEKVKELQQTKNWEDMRCFKQEMAQKYYRTEICLQEKDRGVGYR